MTILSSSNGHAPTANSARRIGSIPWVAPSGEHWQLERWEHPGEGLWWYAVCAGLYLGTTTLRTAEWTHAQSFRSAQQIKDWLTKEVMPPLLETSIASFPSFWPASEVRKPEPCILIFRIAGRRFELREWLDIDPLKILTVVESGFWRSTSTTPTTPVWRVWCDGRFLTVAEIGPELTSLQLQQVEDSPNKPPCACFPTAHDAQLAVEALMERGRKARVVDHLRKSIAKVEQGTLAATIGRGEPGEPSWTVTFRLLPTGTAAKASGGGA